MRPSSIQTELKNVVSGYYSFVREFGGKSDN